MTVKNAKASRALRPGPLANMGSLRLLSSAVHHRQIILKNILAPVPCWIRYCELCVSINVMNISVKGHIGLQCEQDKGKTIPRIQEIFDQLQRFSQNRKKKLN